MRDYDINYTQENKFSFPIDRYLFFIRKHSFMFILHLKQMYLYLKIGGKIQMKIFISAMHATFNVMPLRLSTLIWDLYKALICVIKTNKEF